MEEAYKKAFIKNQHINPKTGRNIKIGGPKHQELTKKYLPQKISPKPSPKKAIKLSPKPSPNVKKVSPKIPFVTYISPDAKRKLPKIVKKPSPKVEKLPNIAKNGYAILDNGGVPFNVKIKGALVEIYKNTYDYGKERLTKYMEFILTYNTEKVFIGRSIKNEMTEFSGAYGPKYDGNSILLQLKNQYIYIGTEIYSFVPLAPIKTYVSPVGNNEVPYPYAIDIKNNYYLMNGNVIILNTKLTKDPFDYYYDVARKGKFYYKSMHIQGLFIGNNEFIMSYFPNPAEEYERLSNNGKLQLSLFDGKHKHIINKQQYIKLMNDYSKKNNLKYLEHKIIVKRQ